MEEIKEISPTIKEISPTIKVNKTANKNKYMSEYMKKQYNKDPIKKRNYKNSLNIKKKYYINEDVWNEYKEQLYNVVQLKEIIDELPDGMFEKFLTKYKTLNFQKKFNKENEEIAEPKNSEVKTT
jgi:hypothetical protein